MSIESIFDAILDFLQDILQGILNFLPDDPFKKFINVALENEYLSAINWIIPVGTILGILQVWLVAVAGYYVWQALLRTVNAID